MESITEELAVFVATFDASTIPSRARTEAIRGIVDLAGTMLAGASEPLGRLVHDHARAEGGDGPSTVIGGGFRSSPSLAAFANGATGHALDYDDIGLEVGHPTVAVAPAALAVAEHTGASGRELLDATVIGYEVASRIGSSLGAVGGPYRRGYHGTSVYGIFGATAAAARLLGLDPRQAQMALGIAASEASGVRVNFGTMTKPYHAGSLEPFGGHRRQAGGWGLHRPPRRTWRALRVGRGHRRDVVRRHGCGRRLREVLRHRGRGPDQAVSVLWRQPSSDRGRQSGHPRPRSQS